MSASARKFRRSVPSPNTNLWPEFSAQARLFPAANTLLLFHLVMPLIANTEYWLCLACDNYVVVFTSQCIVNTKQSLAL